MSSEIKPRRSPRLNKDVSSSSDESEISPNTVELDESNFKTVLYASNCSILLPILYSLYHKFYFHYAVSTSMFISSFYPYMTYKNFKIVDICYVIGFYTYFISSLFSTNPENFHLIFFSEVSILYFYVLFLFLYLKNDLRYNLFLIYTNFSINFTQFYILTNMVGTPLHPVT